MLAKARAAAEDQARALLAHAEPVEQSGHILSQAEESIRKSEVMALTYFDRAVAYVLTRVAGRG